MGDSMKGLMAEAALAPFAGFVVVAGADGTVDEEEVRAFLASLSRVEDSLLLEMIRAAPEPLDERVDLLIEDTERIPSSLAAAGRIFARHPEGPASRLVFMGILADVAAAHGEVRRTEQESMKRISDLLDESAGHARLQVGIAIQGGMAIFGAVAVWQVVSAALSFTAWFVPIAVLLQLVVLAMLLWVGQVLGHSYKQQLAAGSIASVVGGVLNAGSSMLVTTVMYPAVLEASGGTALERALGGFFGTVITGVVLTALLAVFLRR